MPKVLNIRVDGIPDGAVRIDRRSKWGNPFKIGRDGTRQDVILLYGEYLVHNAFLMGSLHELRGKDLCCWCAPLACHGDMLVKLANQVEAPEMCYHTSTEVSPNERLEWTRRRKGSLPS